MSWRSVSAFDGGDNAAPAHIGPHLSRQGATPCTFGQPLRTFHSCRSAHEDNTGRRTAQKSALDVGEPATQCTGEGGRAVHGQGERRAHQFLHLDLCPPRWLFGHPPYFASRCKAGSLMCGRSRRKVDEAQLRRIDDEATAVRWGPLLEGQPTRVARHAVTTPYAVKVARPIPMR